MIDPTHQAAVFGMVCITAGALGASYIGGDTISRAAHIALWLVAALFGVPLLVMIWVKAVLG